MSNNEPLRRVGLPPKREMVTSRDTYVGEVALVGRVDVLQRDRERDREELTALGRRVMRLESLLLDHDGQLEEGEIPS